MKNFILLILCILGISNISLSQTYLPLTGGNLTGALSISQHASFNGKLLLSTASGITLPYVGGVSENSAAGLYFTASPATNIDNTNFTNAFYFDAFRDNAQSFAMTGGNIVNFLNNNVSKFKIDYSGATTLTGELSGTSASFNVADATIGFRSAGATGRFVIYPYFDATHGVLINSFNSAESGYKPMSFQASNYNFLQGNVGIGTLDPQGYKLAVNGNMIAESVRVKLHGSWPDYVFDQMFKLKPLTELEDYIKANRHLPGMPSAGQVEKEGIDMGEMNAKLLEKIEELTLYLIEQNKVIQEQNRRLSILETQRKL